MTAGVELSHNRKLCAARVECACRVKSA